MERIPAPVWMVFAVSMGVAAALLTVSPPPTQSAAQAGQGEGAPPLPAVRPEPGGALGAAQRGGVGDTIEEASRTPSEPPAARKTALEALRSAIDAGAPPEELAACLERAASSGPEAVPLILEAFDARGDDPQIRAGCLQALEKAGGGQAARALIAIAREFPDLLDQAATRLARLSDRAAAEVLSEAARDTSMPLPLRRGAVRALGKTRLREYVPLLREIVREASDGGLRRDAVEALGRIADPDALAALALALRDPDASVRRAAIRALGRIRSPKALELLEKRLKEAPGGLEEELLKTAIDAQRGVQRSPWR